MAIVETRVTRSPLMEAAVKAEVVCPECGARDGIGVTLRGLLDPVGHTAPQTEWEAICPCGCEFVIIWVGEVVPKRG